MKIAYDRISTLNQNLERQIEVFEKFGAEKIFTENYQGKTFQKEPYFKNH